MATCQCGPKGEIIPPGRLGRPRDSRSEETRERLLVAARRCFAEYGFESTTNRQLAAAADLTTGAIYHYFSSKTELYLAVLEQVQTRVYHRFRDEAAAAPDTCLDKLIASLEAARSLNREDPSLATFLVTARSEIPRHPELVEAARALLTQREEFFGAVIDLGIRNGEVQAEDRQIVMDVIGAVMQGLVAASSNDPGTHARAVAGIERLLTGTLLRPVPHSLPS